MMTTKQSLVNQADIGLQTIGTGLKTLDSLEVSGDTKELISKIEEKIIDLQEDLSTLRAQIYVDENIHTDWRT